MDSSPDWNLDAMLSDRPRQRRGRWAFAAVAVGLLAGLAGLAWARWRPAPSARARYEVVRAQERVLPQTVTTTGTIRLRSGAQVRVGAQISGLVQRLNVAVGSHVTAGEVIARIDPRSIEAQVAVAQAQVNMDAAALAKTRMDLRRSQRLLAQALVPRQQTEDLAADEQAAEARLADSRAALAAAQLNLGYTTIRAPIAGTVASVSTQEGETVAASFAAPTFVTIVQPHALEAVAMVDETDIAGVRLGQPVTFTVESYTDRTFRGRVQRIDPTAALVSGVVNYAVVIRIESGLAWLKPDMTANFEISTGTRQTLWVPVAAVRQAQGASYVLLPPEAAPRRQRIATATNEGGWTEILSGLTRPEQVLIPQKP